MTNDLQQARISVEVLNEYRKIAAWLEAQAATRGPVGDTMHGLAAEALTKLIEMEYSRHMIPLYGMLDVWMATRGTSHPEFDQFYSEHGYAETWARLLADVRALAAADAIHSKAKLSQTFVLPTVEMIEKVLADNGLSGLGELHGWRCNHPEVYGECRCVSELIDDLAALFGEVAGGE